jgi:hypothetical protein
VNITGTAPHLRIDGADCQSGTYKVLERDASAPDASCRNLPLTTHQFWYSDGQGYSYWLCLQKL